MLPVQVEGRVQSLSEQYDGPQPSDLCDLLEGEQFFAGFERGLDISTGLKSSSTHYLILKIFFLSLSFKVLWCAVYEMLRWYCPVFSRQTWLCWGKTLFCVLLQPEESEGSVHLSSPGSEGPSEGTSKTDIIVKRQKSTVAENDFCFTCIIKVTLCILHF